MDTLQIFKPPPTYMLVTQKSPFRTGDNVTVQTNHTMYLITLSCEVILTKAVVRCQNKIILKNFRPVGRPS